MSLRLSLSLSFPLSLYIYISVRAHVCMCVSGCACMCPCVCASVCVCVCVRVCACVWVSVSLCMCQSFCACISAGSWILLHNHPQPHSLYIIFVVIPVILVMINTLNIIIDKKKKKKKKIVCIFIDTEPTVHKQYKSLLLHIQIISIRKRSSSFLIQCYQYSRLFIDLLAFVPAFFSFFLRRSQANKQVLFKEKIIFERNQL